MCVNELCILIDSEAGGWAFVLFYENKQEKLYTMEACSQSINSSGAFLPGDVVAFLQVRL